MRPTVAMMVMKTLPGRPKARAYSCTNGCGASREKRVSRSGVQKRNRIVVAKPNTPVAIALDKIPRPATTLPDDQRINTRKGKEG